MAVHGSFFSVSKPSASSTRHLPKAACGTESRNYKKPIAARSPIPVITQSASPIEPRTVAFAHVDFILNRAADTVIPVCIRTQYLDEFCIYHGNLFEASCPQGMLQLRGVAFHIRTGPVRSARLLDYPTAAGPITTLEFLDDGNRVIAAIRGQRNQCIAWKALMAWLMLRSNQASKA